VLALVEQGGKEVLQQVQPGLTFDQVMVDKGGQLTPMGIRIGGKLAAMIGIEAERDIDRQR
jgi:hypothetical protein